MGGKSKGSSEYTEKPPAPVPTEDSIAVQREAQLIAADKSSRTQNNLTAGNNPTNNNLGSGQPGTTYVRGGAPQLAAVATVSAEEEERRRQQQMAAGQPSNIAPVGMAGGIIPRPGSIAGSSILTG